MTKEYKIEIIDRCHSFTDEEAWKVIEDNVGACGIPFRSFLKQLEDQPIVLFVEKLPEKYKPFAYKLVGEYERI